MAHKTGSDAGGKTGEGGDYRAPKKYVNHFLIGPQRGGKTS